jgi:small subunit ribosomal protein S11
MPKNVSKNHSKKVEYVEEGRVCIQATYNNTIITVTDLKGDVLAQASAGSMNFRGSRKSTPFAAQAAAEKVLQEVKDKYRLARVSVRVKGPGQGREAAVRALLALGIEVKSISDITGVPFNGCRPPKERRV